VKGAEHAEVHEMDGGVYQEYGECDPDSELPCRCPRREFVDQAWHIESNFHFPIYDISSRLVRLEAILSRYDTFGER